MIPNQWYVVMDSGQVKARPVGEAHTLFYLRFYQKVLQLPLLGRAFSWLAMPFNRKIAHQDRRVVITQRPKASALRMGERLIQGDRPIVEYRRRRQELIDASDSGLKGD